jgi:NAD(P)-dependent dehydrogenase (short-subunit alcohol dehydrogenase family)
MSIADDIFGLRGRRAIVTGAARGLGRGIAGLLAGLGARVALADRDEAGSRETLRTIEAAGGTGHVVPLDLLDEASIVAMIDAAAEQLGGIDILVNNAAMIGMKPLAEMDSAFWDRMQDVNVRGTFLCAREAARVMRAGGGGRIINISSAAALHPTMDGAAAYCASKGAVNALSRSLALDLAADGILVNVVMPHAIAHPGAIEQFREHRLPEPSGPSLDPARFAVSRTGTVEDVTPLVAMLAGRGGNYITGQAFAVEGGFLLT